MGYTFGGHNGEHLTIAEFCRVDPMRWPSPIYALRHFVPHRARWDTWVDKVVLAHLTDHALYSEYDGLAG